MVYMPKKQHQIKPNEHLLWNIACLKWIEAFWFIVPLRTSRFKFVTLKVTARIGNVWITSNLLFTFDPPLFITFNYQKFFLILFYIPTCWLPRSWRYLVQIMNQGLLLSLVVLSLITDRFIKHSSMLASRFLSSWYI